jgi:regulator of protease activity HflC (stomatin/prohibitin superfamily)
VPNVPNQASNAVSVNTSDGQAFTLDAFVALRPNTETLDELHSRIGQQYMSTIVVPTVRSKLRDVAAAFSSADFYNKARRSQLERRMSDLIRREMPAIDRGGARTALILVDGVFLGTARFPEGLKASLEQKQVASITAQTAAVKAQIQQKETTRRLILAAANRRAIELQGQAAARNAQLADLLFYEKLAERIESARTGGERTPIKVIRIEGGEKSTVFLNVEPQRAAAAGP